MKEILLLILCVSILSCKSDKKEDSLTESINRIGIKKFKVADEYIKDSIVEYIKLDGKEYANQIWIVNEENDTIGGNYFDYLINDTIKLGEVTRMKFQLTKPTIDWESDMFVVMPYDSNKLNDDFSNLSKIELDTFFSLKNDGIPHPELSNLDLPLNHISEFGIEYLSSGKKMVKGIIVERGIRNKKKYERRLYFKDSLFVTE